MSEYGYSRIHLIEILKSMREKMDWEVEEERRELLNKLYPLIRGWIQRFPDLRDIFRPEEIDWLLVEAINDEYEFNNQGRFIKFVANTGYKGELEVDEDGKPLLRHTTLVHLAARLKDDDYVMKEFFRIYNRFDVNYTIDDGLTNFHVACALGYKDVVEKFLELDKDFNRLMPKTNDSPLHLAIYFGHKEVVELLLRNGADPNLADAKGLTPLHVICKRDKNDDGLLEQFFEINDEKHQLVQVNAQDMFGNTPLHSLYKFARYDHFEVTQFLLQRGADPNLANEDGSTLLHLICKRDSKDEGWLTQVLICLCDEVNRPVQVDAVNKLMGQTPLHLAVEYCYQGEVQVNFLLRAGADPNLTDAEGLTPLHIICQRRPGDDLAPSFFYYNDELQQTVLVNARDKLGRTPLQAAVARFLPETVHQLLNHGADLSSFVFPTDTYFSEKFDSYKYCWLTFKLRLASGALDVVKNLEKGGYEFEQSDALAVMKFFAENELFEKSSNLEKSWCDDEEFVSVAIKIRCEKRSLYDLIQLNSIQAVHFLKHVDLRMLHVNHVDHFDRANLYRLQQLPKEPSESCAQHLSEIISREFFRRWSLEPLLELTDHYKLPILCCETIIKKLTNEDLFNICLAAAGQNS